MHLRWMPSAADDLEQIHSYLKENNPAVANATVLKLYRTIRTLKTAPYRGRIGSTEGTRELVFSPLPYIAVYRVRGEVIEMLHIYHAARDWRG